MARIISILGNKGGTGKTTISHMLSQGLGECGHYTVAVLTDTERDKLGKAGRAYLPFDARSPENLEKVIAKLRNTPQWYGVIDGGANRPEMDAKLAGLSDLVLLPFRDSEEDVRTLIRDLQRFPNAYALPSQWPHNLWQKMSASHLLHDMLAAYESRIIAPVYSISASKVLLRGKLDEKLPRHLHQACHAVALQVMELLSLQPALANDAITAPSLAALKTQSQWDSVTA